MKKLKLKGVPIALAVILGSTTALAQQKVEKIEVTGSNIKRVDTETVAPVEIITREQIERTGQPTIADVLRNIPSNTGGSFGESFSNSFAPGAAGISLRGLGQKTTLVLLNGRRTAGYGFAQNLQDTFVDLNSIPSSAVERVEILKDGASAIYGSDAIAGVVNVILRKDYRGFEASISGGSFEGKNDFRTTLTGGFGDLAKDRFSMFGTLDFYKRDQLLLSETEFGKTRDYRNYQGGRNFQGLQTGGTWRQLNATGTAFTNNYRAITECPGVVQTAAQALANGFFTSTNALNQPGNTFCTKDINSELSALPKTERVGFLGRATREFSSTITGSVELGLSRVETTQVFTPPFFAGTTGLTQTAAGLRPFTYNITFAPGVAGNPFNTPARFSGNLFSLGTRDAKIESDTVRILGNLNWVAAGWDFDSAVGYSKNEITQQNIRRQTLSGVSAVFGVPTTAQPPTPTSTSSRYNLDRPSLNSAAVNAETLIDFPRQADSELKFIDTRASREIGQLPGGPVGLALGFEFREEEIQDRPDPNAQNGNILGQGITATSGKRDNTALFAEVSLPLLKSLEAQLAVRRDDYSDFGTSTNPKVGLKFKPSDKFLVRGNWGRGFRAPTLPEISPSVATFFIQVNDPVTGQTGVQVSGVFAGNPSLRPEKSTSANVGMVFEPTKDLSFGIDYYRIEWKDIVSSDAFQTLVNNNDPRVLRDPATNNIVTILNQYRNLNITKTNGVDFDVLHRMNTDWGKITSRLNVSYIDSFKEEGVEYVGTNAGSNTYPRVKGFLTLDLDRGAWAFTGRLNYTHSYQQQLLAGTFFTPQEPAFQNGTYPTKIPVYRTVDLFARYTLNKNLRFSASIINAENKTPPYDPGFSGTFLYDFSQYDVRGRQFRLGVTYKM